MINIYTLLIYIHLQYILKYSHASTSHAPCFLSVKDKTNVLFRFILLKAQHSTSTEPGEIVPDQCYWMILVTLSAKSILHHGYPTHFDNMGMGLLQKSCANVCNTYRDLLNDLMERLLEQNVCHLTNTNIYCFSLYWTWGLWSYSPPWTKLLHTSL